MTEYQLRDYVFAILKDQAWRTRRDGDWYLGADCPRCGCLSSLAAHEQIDEDDWECEACGLTPDGFAAMLETGESRIDISEWNQSQVEKRSAAYEARGFSVGRDGAELVLRAVV